MQTRRNKFLVPVVVAAVLSASISFPQVAFAVEQDLFVDDGPSVTCDNAGTEADPFQSVQCAISAATSGDTIRVAAGEYAGFTVNKPLTILGPKAATSPAASDDASASWGDASGWAVVKASSGRVIQVTAAADGTVIKGLAITSTNGSVTPAANGVLGIDLLGPDNITIQNNYFYDLYNVAITSSGAPATPRASSYLIDSNLIASAKGPFESRGSYYGTEVAAVNPWYVNDLTFSNNRIFGYGRGVQLEQNSGAVVRSNYISDIFYHGIQAANGQSNTLIEGNTVDRAQMGAYYEYFYGGYCSGAIRLWTVDTSSGFVVRNNLVSNTGATQRTGIADDYRDLCPAIALNGSNSAAVSSITDNSISNASNRSGSTNPGLGIVWTANQVVSAAVSGGTATVRTFGANSLATGDVVTIANLGAPFDGSWTVTKSGTRTVTFAIPGAANVSRGQAAGGGYNAPSEATAIVASAGATIVRTSSPTQVGAISASNNWWGSAGGPGTVGSTVNAGGSAVTSSLNISSYVNDPTKSGQPGFWPTMVNVPSAPGTPTATAGNGRATISWTAPSSGVSPFTYTVSSSPEGAACVPSGLTALCTGLSNLTPYTFTVTATNEFGSAVSSASDAVEGSEQDWFVDDGSSVACNDLGTEADPFQSVQCAIDVATSADTIRVKAGTYAGFAVNKALTILGPNDEVAPGPEASRQAEAVITSSVSISSALDGVTLSGFSLSSTNSEDVGLSVGSNSQNVTITYNEISGFDQGIRSAGNDANFGSNMDVSYNYIHGLSLASFGSYAIHLRNVKNVTVSDNIVTDSVTDPVLTGSQMRRGIVLRGAQDAVVSNNTVDFGSAASTRAYYAISIAQLLNDGVNGNDISVSNVQITGNTLSGAVNGINFLDLGAQATNVEIEGNTARDVFVGVSFKSFGQSGATVVQELLVQRNDFSDIASASGVLSAGVQVYSIDVTLPATNEFDGVVVQGNKLPSNRINQLSEINGLMVGAINPFAAGFPNVLTFYATDITDLDARANFWGGEAPTTDIARQANVAGAMLTGSYSDDPSKAGQPGFSPSCSSLEVVRDFDVDVHALFECPLGAPGTPTAVAGNGRATISWTEPTFGAAPFTYTVSSSPEGAACVVDGLTALCTGLSNLTPYTFTVTATNEFGSAVSSASDAVEGSEQDWFVDDGSSVACNDLGTEADPFQSVQCAIDVATSGDTIRVKAGTYAGFAVNKALTILGPNDEVAPGPGIERSPEAVIESAVSISSALDGVTLSGFSLAPTSAAGVGVSVGSNTENVSITYNDISGFDQGIRSEGNSVNFGSNMDVSYNYIHGLSLASFGSYAIHLRNVKNVTVSDNIVTDSVTDPVLTGSQMRRGIVLRGAQDAVVSNNTVDFGSAASTRAYYAISIAQLLNDGVNGNDISVSNVQITGNTLSGAVNGINFLDLGAQATDVLIEGNTARDVFVGVSFRSYGQTSATVVDELVVQRNDFSNIDSALGVLSAGVQVFSIDFTQPVLNEFDGVVVNGNKLPSNKINQLSQINGLLVGAINPFAAGFPNVLTFYATDITDLDARANFWGGGVPTTDIARQANVAGAMLTGSYSDDPSKAGQPGFWPLSTDANLTDLSLSTGTLTPVFASDTTNYTVRVPASFTSFAVTPTKSDTKASMAQFVGASGTTPFTGELGGRETIIRVVVTAEDGTTKTYRVTVTRFNFTPQIITFTPVASITATTATYALVASANSGLTVAFDSTTNDICTVSGTTLTPVKAGLCVITASQAGNDTFYAPASVNKSIVITRAAQSITGFNPSAMTTLSSPQTLSATKGLGSAPVTFSTNSSGVCSIVGTSLTVVAPGTCVVAASQAEDSRYAAASVMKSITITKVAQSITGFNPSAMTTLSSPQTLSATKGLGTAPVTFSTSSTGVCAIVGTSLTAVAAGTCVVTASQAEDGRYAAANNVTKSITISKAAQAIVFTPVASLSAAAPSYALTATAGVGATVAFASTTPLVCTVSGTTLTPVKAGTCSITASQVGNATYLAATNVSKSITINLASQATLTVSNSTKFAFKKGVPVTLTSSGGSGTGNAVTFSVRGTGCSISAGALTVATTTRPGSLVSCSVTATRAGNAIYLPATSTATNFFFQNR